MIESTQVMPPSQTSCRWALAHSLVLCSWWPRRHLRLFTSFLSLPPRFPGSATNDLSESQATSLAVKQQNTLIYSPTNISLNREVKEIITRIKGTGCCKTRRRLMSVIVRVRANADVEGLSRAMTEGGLWFMERIGSTLDFLRLQNREFESSQVTVPDIYDTGQWLLLEFIFHWLLVG